MTVGMSTQLDEQQRQQVSRWIAEGLKLSEIQTRLAKELGLKLTYMEVRLLVDDLKLVPKDVEPPKTPDLSPAPPQPEAQDLDAPVEPLPAAGKVSVSVDQITRPGSLVSGKVNFSDGQQAEWYLDQFGQLGLAPKQKGYKPSQADVREFQVALQNEMARLGY